MQPCVRRKCQAWRLVPNANYNGIPRKQYTEFLESNAPFSRNNHTHTHYYIPRFARAREGRVLVGGYTLGFGDYQGQPLCNSRETNIMITPNNTARAIVLGSKPGKAPQDFSALGPHAAWHGSTIANSTNRTPTLSSAREERLCIAYMDEAIYLRNWLESPWVASVRLAGGREWRPMIVALPYIPCNKATCLGKRVFQWRWQEMWWITTFGVRARL